MPSEQQIDRAAAAAAEKANGGKFSDPLFYKEEHKIFWREVVRAALNASSQSKKKSSVSAAVTKEEVAEFSSHCSYVRSVYVASLRIWKDSTHEERKLAEAIAPTFFADFSQVFADFIIVAACRITDAAIDNQGNENFTVEMFLNDFPPDSQHRAKLDDLYGRMNRLREKILPARRKLAAHADRAVIQQGKALAGGSWADWEDFWSALAEFVRILNEEKTGSPFEIDANGVKGDAESLFKSLRQSQYFEKLLSDGEKHVRDACLALMS